MVVEPVCPALVVMHGDMLRHVGELIEVSRRIHAGAPTASDTIIDFRPAGAYGGEHFVGGAEIVALGLFRVGTRVRKDDGCVPCLHHAGALCGIGNQIGQFFV